MKVGAVSSWCLMGTIEKGFQAWTGQSFFPTSFLSNQFWNLTFASLPAFQTYRSAGKCRNFICPLQRNNGHPCCGGLNAFGNEPSGAAWLAWERAQSHKAQPCSNVSISHFIGFYSAWKASLVFPWKKSVMYSLHKDYYFIRGNDLFIRSFIAATFTILVLLIKEISITPHF